MRYYSHVRKKFKANDIIFSENSESDGMYIIESGKVRVFTHAPSDNGSQEVELCTLGPNSMFGEMALIDNGKRSATVQAIEETMCTVITKKMFEDQLERIPSWMVNMIRILVIRLRETNERLRGIIQHYSIPPADGGTVITISGEKRTNADLPREGQSEEGYSVMNRFYKDKIIQELEDLMTRSSPPSDTR